MSCYTANHDNPGLAIEAYSRFESASPSETVQSQRPQRLFSTPEALFQGAFSVIDFLAAQLGFSAKVQQFGGLGLVTFQCNILKCSV